MLQLHGIEQLSIPMEPLRMIPTLRSLNGTEMELQSSTWILELTPVIPIMTIFNRGLVKRRSILPNGTASGLKPATPIHLQVTELTSVGQLQGTEMLLQAAELVLPKVGNWSLLELEMALRFSQQSKDLNGPINTRFPGKMNTTFVSFPILGARMAIMTRTAL